MLILCLLLIAADRAIKLWTESAASFALSGSGAIYTVPNLVRFRVAHNTGASFSLLSEHTALLTVVTGLILLGIAVFLFRKRKSLSPTLRLGLTLMLAGGIGNWIDRAFYGYVVDYIELLFVRFAVFNFADILVCAGTGLTIFSLIVPERKKGR
ncbi:MAG: signal peptidase II [Christensenellales bacterium]|jgi:signal peptidase II